jgi:hypothetical protein
MIYREDAKIAKNGKIHGRRDVLDLSCFLRGLRGFAVKVGVFHG